MTSIKNIAIHSLKWSTVEKVGQFSIQLVISIVLAQILEPEQYAVIGILNIFISIANVLVDAGFSQVLIRKQNCDEKDYNCVFWFNLLMSACIYAICFVCMPWIAAFFDSSQLVLTGRVLMIIIPLNALNVVQLTIVNKELQFKKIAKYTVLVTPVAGITGIMLAYSGFGVWALIWQSLLYSLLMVLVLWLKSDWLPSFKFDITPLKEYLGFSLKLSGASLLNTTFNNISPTVIAKFFDKAQFGYFSQAQRYATMPSTLIESILNRLTYPLLAKLQDDKEQYYNAYRNMQMVMFAIMVPMMLLLIICAKEVIPLVLGDKWSPSIPYFQILCLSAITLPFHPQAMSNLKVFGRSGTIFNLEIVKKVLIILAVVGGLPWGVKGLVWGQAIYFWIALLLNMYYGGLDIKYSLQKQVSDISPSVILSVIALMCSFLINLSSLNSLLLLISKIVVFALVYILGVLMIKTSQFEVIKRNLIRT